MLCQNKNLTLVNLQVYPLMTCYIFPLLLLVLSAVSKSSQRKHDKNGF